jgi:hypothetical protein
MLRSIQYRGYTLTDVRPGFHRRVWTVAVLHPTERGRSMTARTMAGAKRIVDAICDGTVAW